MTTTSPTAGRIVAAVFVGIALALAVGAALAAFAVWLRLAPGRDDWTVPVPLRVAGKEVVVDISVARALEAATDPRWARWIEGRRLATPLGLLRPRWRPADGTLVVACAPCRLRDAALGDAPIELAQGELELRRLGERRYIGRLRAGEVELPFELDVTRRGLTLAGRLPPTRIAALYALLGEQVPEARVARIEGELAARVSLALPARQWAVDPRVEAFAVTGLGTELLADADPPSACRPLPAAAMPNLERAVIASEDQRFMQHPGYDLTEMRLSLDHNQRRARPARGASTITQQLAKLAYVGDDRSLARKARELLYAVEMERTLGKGRILTLYLSLAPWGKGICGAEAAARRYVGRSAASLDARQSRVVARELRYAGSAPTAGHPH